MIVSCDALKTSHIVPLIFEGKLLGESVSTMRFECDYTKFKILQNDDK